MTNEANGAARWSKQRDIAATRYKSPRPQRRLHVTCNNARIIYSYGQTCGELSDDTTSCYACTLSCMTVLLWQACRTVPVRCSRATGVRPQDLSNRWIAASQPVTSLRPLPLRDGSVGAICRGWQASTAAHIAVQHTRGAVHPSGARSHTTRSHYDSIRPGQMYPASKYGTVGTFDLH
jgi:hypothetical protein